MLLTLLLLLQGAAPAAAPPPEDKVVCRYGEPETGSRLPGKRTCRRKSEWAAIEAQRERERDRLESLRSQRARPSE